MHSMHRTGFTLVELLLTIGIIGVLAAIVIIAINPTRQLSQARGANRSVSIRELENAIAQYIIDGNSISGIPAGQGNAADVCRDTVTGTTCTDAPVSGIDLSDLTTNGTYLNNVPIDPEETDTNITGYKIYLLGSFIKVCSQRIDAGCGA